MSKLSQEEKIKVNRAGEIAIEESMRNLSDYVATLGMKTDITLYLHFEAIINALFENQKKDSKILLNLPYYLSQEVIIPKYKLVNGELILEGLSNSSNI